MIQYFNWILKQLFSGFGVFQVILRAEYKMFLWSVVNKTVWKIGNENIYKLDSVQSFSSYWQSIGYFSHSSIKMSNTFKVSETGAWWKLEWLSHHEKTCLVEPPSNLLNSTAKQKEIENILHHFESRVSFYLLQSRVKLHLSLEVLTNSLSKEVKWIFSSVV